jgi:hypothetical protein
MRRLLRKIASGVTSLKELGDISTLADPEVVEQVIEKMWPGTFQPKKKTNC